MQQDMIQIRYEPRLAHREETDRVTEAVVIPLQFGFARAEKGIIPMA